MANQQGLADRLAQRTKQRSMCLVSPKPNEVSTYLTNGATVTNDIGRGPGMAVEGLPTTWALSVPAGRTAGGDIGVAWWRWQFYGDSVGLGLIKRYGTFQPDNVGLAVRIDHRTYDLQELRAKNADGAFGYDSTAMLLIDDDLPKVPDGRAHLIEVGLVGDPTTGGNTRYALIAGIFCDEISGGYRPAPRRAVLLDSIDVPTVAAALPTTQTGGESFAAIRAVRKVHYCNTNASARTVTVTYQGGNGVKTMKVLYLAATGSAGDSAELDFGEDVVLPLNGTRFLHVASGSGVTATIQGKI